MKQGFWPEGPLSLRGRLLAWLTALAVVLVLGAGVSAYTLAEHFAGRVFDNWLSDTAHSIAIAVQAEGRLSPLRLPASLERQVRWDTTDDTALMVVGTVSGLIAGRADLPLPPPHSRVSSNTAFYPLQLNGQEARAASVAVVRSNGEHVRVVVAETLQKRRALALDILVAALTPVVLLAIAAGLLVTLGVRSALKPLAVISQQVQAQDPLRLKPLPAASAPAEVRPLMESVNALLLKLNDNLAHQRDFVADTAHQLRTPLAGLKVQLEEALNTPASVEAAGFHRSLLRGVERASRLSSQLLALARAEADQQQRQSALERFDLCAFAADAGADWAVLAAKRGSEMSLATPAQPVWALGTPHLLHEAIDNLLDNALKYAGAKAQIRITVQANPNPRLTVADSGAGFPKSLDGKLFQRFARGDRSGSDGAGLGLAIVREALRAQGGEAQAGNAPEGGAVVVLQLLPAGAGAEVLA